MLFVAGIIVGLLIAAIAVGAIGLFRVPIEKAVRAADLALKTAGPRPKGYIVEPNDEATEARKRIIKKNSAQGKDTPFSELVDEE